MLMLESQRDQIDRRRVMRNDARVKEQQRGTTFSQFAQADAEIPGRFAAVAGANVIGSRADISGAYPACSPALAVQLPTEPPLGLDNPALESTPLALSPTQGTGPTLDAHSARVGPLSLQAAQHPEVIPASGTSANAGPSLPPFRR